MRLTVMEGRLAVCRLEAGAAVPGWAWRGELVSVTRTGEELSVVCADEAVPEGARAERGFRALKVEGPLDFGLTGVLAGLSRALAEAGVSLFALSTFDTDYLFVRDGDLVLAIEALRGAGYGVVDSLG